MTPLQNMTVEQLEKAADDYVEKFQKVARNAFMEAVSWAIQVANGELRLRISYAIHIDKARIR